MARKKLDSSTESTSDVQTGQSPKASPKKDAVKPAPAKESEAKGSASPAAPAGKRILSQDEIGHVAGEVWHLLSNQGTQTLPGLKKAIDAPGDIVLAAIGWLAREGKLDLQAKGRSVKVSLR